VRRTDILAAMVRREGSKCTGCVWEEEGEGEWAGGRECKCGRGWGRAEAGSAHFDLALVGNGKNFKIQIKYMKEGSLKNPFDRIDGVDENDCTPRSRCRD